jgi:putative sterol carrier protein
MDTREFFSTLEAKSDPTKLEGVENSYLFDINGEGRWLVDVHGGKLTVTENPEAAADVTFSMSGEVFEKLRTRQQNPLTAYATGKLKVTGDIGAAMALQKIL